MLKDSFIEQIFPDIKNNYKITSPVDPSYNCIAFAAGDTNRWWWPSKEYYWPQGIPLKEDLNSFIACFKSLGFEECDMDGNFVQGYDKVAIFVDPDNKPTHAARQFGDGVSLWKSKLGEYKDIEHTLEGISGWYSWGSYGHVAVIMKRKIK